MSNQLSFSFDVSRCSGCMACIVACQDQNDFVSDIIAYRHVTRHEFDGRLCFLSLSCLHCGNAPCMMVCPSGAIFKREQGGIIDVNRDLCIGCHSCELACPFGAPKFAEDGKMAKCDFCNARMEYGHKPACVRVCPTRALDMGPLDKLSEIKSEKAAVKILKSFAAAKAADS